MSRTCSSDSQEQKDHCRQAKGLKLWTVKDLHLLKLPINVLHSVYGIL